MKHIFFDIDGTLVGESKKVTKKTREAIQTLKEKGNKVYICTGRAPTSINNDVRSIGFDGIIGSAGGFIEVNGEYIYENRINPYLLSEVMLLFTNSKILFSLETKDALYQTPGVAKFFEEVVAKRHIKNNLELERFLEERRSEEVRLPIHEFKINHIPVTKLCFISPDKFAFYDTVKYLSQHFHIVLFSSPEDPFVNGEIILKDCTKGDGMRRIIEHVGGNMEDTIAYGDSMNDYQMIQSANIGVVSVLSTSKLKVVADDYFEDPDEDGIANHLEKLGLV